VVGTSPRNRGDSDLADQLGRLAGGLATSIAVAVVAIEGTTETHFAFTGADAETRFEIGSITKGLTGMILSDAIDRREISLDTTVGEVFHSISGDVGSITVQELCTHTSGLPRMPRRSFATLRSLRYSVLQLNPYYGFTTSGMLKHTAQQYVSARGHRRYSNLGAAVLGQMLATRSGVEYPQLLKDRILDPMGLHSTHVATRGNTAPWG
jgi:CubicO group peptidase (beta-lactamase class C family)